MLPLIVAILIAAADQLTKVWVHTTFAFEDTRAVIPGLFSLTYVRNTGAAWGMFGGQSIALTGLSVVMLCLMIVYRRKFLDDTLQHRFVLGLIAGGIIGNVIDRIRLGFVIDFLDFHIAGHHWPCFNIADSAICTAVGLYILSTFRSSKSAEKSAQPAG